MPSLNFISIILLITFFSHLTFNINNEVARLRNLLQLLQFCRDRESQGQNFPLDMMKVKKV